MKTCKMGCGKMKSGGTIKKVKKMAMGGSATNKLNNPKAPTKPMKGGGNTKMGIYGVPNAGPTGPNIQGVNTMKSGGAVRKLVKAQKGISTGGRKEVGKDIIKKDPPYKFSTKEARDSSRIYADQMKNMKLDDPKLHSTVENYERQYKKGKSYPTYDTKTGKFKNKAYDSMGYQKDDQGRSKGDKWYGFDPKTKKYTMGPNKGKTHGQVLKSKSTKK